MFCRSVIICILFLSAESVQDNDLMRRELGMQAVQPNGEILQELPRCLTDGGLPPQAFRGGYYLVQACYNETTTCAPGSFECSCLVVPQQQNCTVPATTSETRLWTCRGCRAQGRGCSTYGRAKKFACKVVTVR
eukprot:CAMPEP_0197657604 /NCGR_PEP_ID=MMETSP1338-20131121/44732_1 /TAXON_ID=43686 ORGANISM="Pelagodinium beii, Strain RCC1491" /NCGR_SAMPLE_ID=MMETSP1338 /ASSEMBLY_ACC=CAM_ASM_000754 /LENGTH=133 /DNA_ID=CAMNT_0043234015 /DNA_START=73 /DNA_END=474 /DNA_ORIENTATION=-